MKVAIILIFFISSRCFSQLTQPITTIKIASPVEVSIDPIGNVYLATYNGNIIKYTSSLAEKYVFSPSNPNTISLLEAWQGLRIFSFQQDLQQFRLVNRNLSLYEDYSFPSGYIGFAEIAFPSADNNVWLVDQRDLSLKKYNMQLEQITIKTPLDLILKQDNYKILHAREYQNRLFISTGEHGILIFDNLGNYLKTYPYKDISFFCFQGDDLYFIQGNSLVQINLYEEREKISELPGGEKWKFVLLNGDRTYLFSDQHLVLYK